ncbi:DUF2182 domain-containing protein [Azoarcus sp. KH32C]|uniref:DUF2182 domain-containing protein n=1 Tax=Azoarcus sp. KH32C TaxID=748247 RepID=UPI0003480219|nr:DUF2182 domain-containing protein [Azoarcus sp. KH32C]
MPRSLHRNATTLSVGLLIALAWFALWAWERSPYARYLHHGELAGFVEGNELEVVLEQGALYIAGWLLMTCAMMLPTAVPLIQAFERMTAQRDDRRRLVALVIAGYLGVWLVFGVAAHLFDFGLHELFEHIAWLQTNPWVFGAAPLLLAGLFQFSELKYRCLDRCRAPVGFIFQHWRGGGAGGQSFAIGAHHGLFCVGCCWALMLLMFAVGTGNIGWMLALGTIMAIEKNHPRGRLLGEPLGVALIAWGTAIAFEHAWTWQ